MRYGKVCALLLGTLASPAFATMADTSETGDIEIVNLTGEEMNLTSLHPIAPIFQDAAGTQPLPGIAIDAGQSRHLYVQPIPLSTPAAVFSSSDNSCLLVARDTPSSRPNPPSRPVWYTAHALSGDVTCTAEAVAPSAGVTWAVKLTIRQ